MYDSNAWLSDTKLVAWLRKVGGASTGQIAKHFNISVRSARRRVAALVSSGFAVEIGSGPKDPQRRYIATNVDFSAGRQSRGEE